MPMGLGVSMGCWTLSMVFSTNEGLITAQPARDCVPASPEEGRGKMNVEGNQNPKGALSGIQGGWAVGAPQESTSGLLFLPGPKQCSHPRAQIGKETGNRCWKRD